MIGANLHTRNTTRGFTMVEVLVVIGIIGILAAVSLPNILGFVRGAKIRAAQDSVIGAMQKARNAAIMKNTQMGITFVTENESTFWIHVEDTIAGFEAGGSVGFTRQGVDFGTPVAVQSTRHTLPDGVVFADTAIECPLTPGFAPNQSSVRFDRYGSPSLPGMVLVPAAPVAPILILNGASVTTDFIYVPAGSTDLSVCVFDPGSGLRSLIQISRAGRIARR